MSSLFQEKGIDASANNHSYSGHELPRIVTGVSFYDVFASSWMVAPLGHAVSMRPLPNARIQDEEPFSQRDIAAFIVESTARISPAPQAAAKRMSRSFRASRLDVLEHDLEAREQDRAHVEVRDGGDACPNGLDFYQLVMDQRGDQLVVLEPPGS